MEKSLEYDDLPMLLELGGDALTGRYDGPGRPFLIMISYGDCIIMLLALAAIFGGCTFILSSVIRSSTECFLLAIRLAALLCPRSSAIASLLFAQF